MKLSSFFYIFLSCVVVALLGLFNTLPDFLWFKSFQYSHIWMILAGSKVALFLVSFLVTSCILLLNLFVTNRNCERNSSDSAYVETRFEFLNRFLNQTLQNTSSSSLMKASSVLYKRFLIGGTIALSLFVSMMMMHKWQIVSFYLYQQPYGLADPIFGKDISFYFFSLPFYTTCLSWILLVLGLAVATSAWIYFTRNILIILFSSSHKTSRVKWHLFFLIGLLLCCFGVLNYLNIYELMFSTRGAVVGIGYSDAHVLVPAYKLFSLLLIGSGLVFFINAFQKQLKLPVIALCVLGLFYIVGLGIVPNMVQSYVVKPNEVNREREYIEKNIEFTRHAYGLNNIKENDFLVSNTLTKEDILDNHSTMKNIRLWNKEPLQKTFKQLQEIRLYYEFDEIDVDRYMIDGELQQVMLSPRELDADQLDPEAQRWLNLHLMYTHGFGLCMSPVNEVTTEGLPLFYLKDLPTKSTIPSLKVTRPELYFGEKVKDYVIVNTHQPEFNYPKGSSNEFNTYEGTGGVLLDSFFKRALYALKFNEIKIFISSVIHKESRILYDREIRTIVSKLAPFIFFDSDPYLVVTEEGRLVWMIDGYTHSGYFPYAKYKFSGINYIRNSVKATIDAYDGDVNFYISDDKDPIIATMSTAFPGLFQSFSKMPRDLKHHIRVPEFYFDIQADIYRSYHMSDPQVFYNREDIWELPKEIYGNSEAVMKSYYIVTTLPGEDKPSFLLMQPFSPRNKNNMIAWMSVKCDLDSYGEMNVYNFPKEKTVFGPMQIESRIDQDTQISKDLTLWGQVGSDVIRGNLMAIPINDSLVYVEPIYLQATQSKFPELKRVIFSYNDSVVMDTSLEKAVYKVFGEVESAQQKVDVSEEQSETMSSPSSLTILFKELDTTIKKLNSLYDQLKKQKIP